MISDIKLFILTGPPGSGKNTISEALAEMSKKLAIIDVDIVRWMIRRPHKAPWEGAEGKAQQFLGVQNTCMLAKSFIKEGYDVVILDVLSEETTQIYREELNDLHPKIILLLPTLEEIKKRNANRPPRLKPEEIEQLYTQQASLTSFDMTINNTNLKPEKIAEKLIAD